LDIGDYWDKKQAAIECYRTQFVDNQPPGQPTLVDRLRQQAAGWGWSIGVRYGEPFASREPIGLGSLSGLV
jgi:LmbE family N-acetylglucosaminyl deacetylase